MDGVIEIINSYLTKERVRKKYKIDSSKKVILLMLEYTNVLGYFVDVYNEIHGKKLYEEIMEHLRENIYFDNFFDQIIVALEPRDSDGAVYFVLEDCAS